MKSSHGRTAGLAAAVIVLSIQALVGPAIAIGNYAITEIDFYPDGSQSYAQGINSLGQLAAVSAGSVWRTYRWDNGVKTECPVLPGMLGCMADGGINDNCDIVGRCNVQSGDPMRATLWRLSGGSYVATDLGYLSLSGRSIAYDINAAGDKIVGGAEIEAGVGYAVVWLWNGSSWVINQLPGGQADTRKIGASGSIAGSRTYGGLTQAAMWKYTGSNWVLTPLGNPLSSSKPSWGTGINDAGDKVVGIAADTNNYDSAVVWEYGTQWVARILPMPSGSTQAEAWAISPNGNYIVGQWLEGTTLWKACVWEKSGTDYIVYDLNLRISDPNWFLKTTAGVNNNGWIVGQGFLNGLFRGYLLNSETEPPSVPTNVTATGQSATQVVITWAASTDNVGVTGYKVYRNGALAGTAGGGYYMDSGLTPNTTYSYTVSAYDGAGNNSGQSSPPATAFTDGTAPSVPKNVSATAQSSTSIVVSWTASTDNVGVSGYEVYRNGSPAGASATTSYTDTGLTPSTTYSYTISAYDAVGNESAQSSPAATARTSAVDTTPPSVPSNVTATAQSSSSIRVTWTASTDNVGVTGYKIYRNTSQVGISATANYTDYGLQSSTTYSYTVSAYDAVGNSSAQSSPPATARTPASWSQWLWQADNHSGSSGNYTSNWTDGTHKYAMYRNDDAWDWYWNSPSAGVVTVKDGGAGASGRASMLTSFDDCNDAGSAATYWNAAKGITVAARVYIPSAAKASGNGNITISVSNASTSGLVDYEGTGASSFGVWWGWDVSGTAIQIGSWTPSGNQMKGYFTPKDAGGNYKDVTAKWTIWTLSAKRDGTKVDWDLWIDGIRQDAVMLGGDGQYHTYVGLKATDMLTSTAVGQRRSQTSAHESQWDYVGVTNYGVVAGWDGVTPPADIQAPSVPTGVTASAQSETSIRVTWTASTDNVGVTGYKVYRNGSQVGTSTTTSYTDTGLTPSTTYSYTVSAYDAAGNNSAASSPAATAKTPDNTAPSVPAGVAASAKSPSVVQVSWSASTDNAGVTGYKVYRNASQVGTSATTSYTDTGLSTNTTYSYTVSAYDAAGNNSAASSPAATAKTMAAIGIATARQYPDSSAVGLVNKMVTAVYADHFYVEETTRNAGIKVVPLQMPSGLDVGKTVDVGGTMQTGANRERYIGGATVSVK